MNRGNATCWSDLSLELWINILSRLEGNFAPRHVWEQRECLETYAEMHSNMQKLRLVCSKFKAALDDAQLSRCLFLREDFKYKNLPHFLRWVERQRTSVRLFACNVGTPALEATLAALACTESQLRFAYAPELSQAAMDILPCYSVLHSVDLGAGGDSPPLLDLQPLAALPSLGKLVLTKGSFKNVEALLHLTNLQLSDANVTSSAACTFASKLVKLRVHDSRLFLHGQGLVACHNLRDLMLRRCKVRGSHLEDSFSLIVDEIAQVPAGMSSLTHLTSLDVTLCGDDLEEIEFSWLGSLTSLQNLGFYAQEDVELPAELTQLTSLTKLWLTTADSDSEVETSCMYCMVNWHGMQTLNTLCIGSGRYAFDEQLLQVAACNALKMVYFDKVMPDSANSAKFFAGLMHILAVKRPDVACYLDNVCVSDMFE